ncbi:transposase [Paeniglutamicibacter cryotolerans]|uniref:Transposase n=1 Tax=Paeniglutamicibacter cryotolerans TaxID=670079 RepID=A0A839QJ65_9MICC|nr:transposase [Paeniglutamicibacter cryotolerans]
MNSPSSSIPQDGLFDASLVERLEPVDDGLMDANGGERKRFRAFEPDAVMLVPPSLEEWLPEGHLARFIAELVENELDLTRFYASHKKAKGQPPYDPRLMLRIVLYGYCTGVRSSRQLERACTDVVALRWLAAQQAPDFRSIGRFRQRHLAALANVFLQALELCRAAGMVKLGMVALDGTKLRANASRHKAMSYARLTEKQKVLAQEISDLMAEAKTVDESEDAKFGPGKRGDELPVELANRQARSKAMAAARASLEQEAADKARVEAEEKAAKRGDDDDEITGAGDTAARESEPRPAAQRNFTDPQARIMKTADGSYHYCYNAQAVVDAGHQVIVAAELGQGANDYGQLVPMVERVQENLGMMPKTLSADAGYCSKANLVEAGRMEAEHGTGFFISTARVKHATPIPESPRGRIPANATLGERMARKLKTKPGKQVYSRRKVIVEPVFGQIKTRQGKHLLLRGLQNAQAEWKLLAAGHNLLKLHAFRAQGAG